MVRIANVAAFAAACMTACAHPGEKHDAAQIRRELVAREHWARCGKESLDTCSNSASSRRFARENNQRRSRVVRELREKRGLTRPAAHLERRNLTELEAYEVINHNKTGILNETSDVFGSISAILTPTVTNGPYYVWGELQRENVVEALYCQGIPLHLEIQYYDVETCEPIPGLYVDIWNTNATGVYSGISQYGNYAVDGYNSTYLRGIQKTAPNGVATFDTIFPGHYDGRATHTHILVHQNVTVLANGTLKVDTGSIPQISQLFWNEILRGAVEATYPYTTNTQNVVSNEDDQWAPLQASANYDPFPEFLYLGDQITDGLYAWKQIGVNRSLDYTDNSYYSIAAYLEADGGHKNLNDTFQT